MVNRKYLPALQQATVHSTPFVAERTWASVALMLAGADDALHLAFILRADRQGDPWSGHMAFPGGRADPTDASARAVAERETWEELGLALQASQFVAPLDEVLLLHVQPPMRLSPFVYDLGPERVPFAPNGEVAEAFWIPLADLALPAHATHKTVVHQGTPYRFPAIRHGQHLIWGVTWRVLAEFMRKMGRPLAEGGTLETPNARGFAP